MWPENRKRFAHTFNATHKEWWENQLARQTANLLKWGVSDSEIASLYTGGKIATGGLATLHPGEEVLEAAEISRIERALSGQSLNQLQLNRLEMGGRNVNVGAGSTMIDNSVTTMNNTTINPMITRGQMLPGESRSIRPRAAL